MEQQSKKHSVISNIRYAYRPVRKDKPVYLVKIAAEIILFVAMPLMGSWCSAYVVALLGKERPMPVILVSIMSVFAIYGMIIALHSYFSNYNNMSYIDMRLSYHFRPMSRKSMEVSLEQFEDNEIRQVMEKANMAVANNYEGVEGTLRHTSLLLTNILGLVVYSLIVGGMNPRILLMLLVISAVSTLISNLSARTYNRIKDQLAVQNRMQRYIDKTVDDISGGKDIRIFGLSDWLIGKYDKAIREERRLYFRYDVMCYLAEASETILSAGRNLVCYLYLISLLKAGMPVDRFVFYLGLITGFAAWFSEISKMCVQLKKDSQQVDDLRENSDIQTGMEDKGMVPEDQFASVEVVFDHVSYSYKGTETPVLKDVTFVLKPGEHLALVGLNGAGKSTLVKLMSGLYLPTKGRVLVNGIDTRQLNRVAYMKQIAAIFQNPFTVSYRIGENIALDDTYDSERIWKVLKAAGLYDKIQSLPNQLDTYLGKDISPEGIQLSGGEMQKLLLARALYRNPKLILLDEPTAALDAIAENEIYENYSRSLKDRSSIFISHRLASTKFCDEIILLENGCIKEQGTHEELMEHQGSYAELFNVQCKYYKEEA